jgi:tripartite-type tricarboxylate transporter receptor subunit TctC
VAPPNLSGETLLSEPFRTLPLAVLALWCGAFEPCQAEPYPTRPIRLVVPYTATSPNDVVARLIAPCVSDRLRRPLIVENRPGGATSIGVKSVATAAPDGYTLLLANIPNFFIVPLVNKNATYDPIKDFVPIAVVAANPILLVITHRMPARSVAGLIEYAKSNPGKVNFGFGQGTVPQLVGELFAREAGIDVARIPYKGGAQVATDLLSGQIDMNFGALSTLVPLIDAGKLKGLAITSPERNPSLPNVPTMKEVGFAKVTSVTAFGIFGPAALSASTADQLNAAVNGCVSQPELQSSMTNAGFSPKQGAPHELATFLADEMRRWTPIIEETGFKLE